jgi:Raf kinase inhibitor-like YbhB/YbcL family protein
MPNLTATPNRAGSHISKIGQFLETRDLFRNRSRFLWPIFSCALVAALSTCSAAEKKEGAAKLELKSPAFIQGGKIPRQATCDGGDISPALSWSESPQGTQSFALITEDPDAPSGTFVHWVVYNLPANARSLPERIPGSEEIPGGGMQGTNDFPATGYEGPCPPPGKPHRYFFKLYALDSKLDLKAGARKLEVEQAMKGHVLAQGQLMARYGR